MVELSAIIISTIILNLNYAATIRHNSFCVTNSIISPKVDGKYEFKYQDTNSIGSIYYNKQSNLYLYPWVESDHFKQYLIGGDPSKHQAFSFSTTQQPSPYIFIEEDFITNWQSYDNETNLINDTSMRLVNCNPVCVHSVTYEWINYNLSQESAIYYSNSTGIYLHRSNINQNTEKWQKYDGKNYETLFSQFSAEINMQACDPVTTDLISDDTNTTYTIPVNEYVENNDQQQLLTFIIATSVGVICILITITIILKRCVLRSRREHTKSHTKRKRSDVNLSIRTNSITTTKERKFTMELTDVIRNRTLSAGSAVSSEEDMGDIVRKRTCSISQRSARSISKYADILPVGKPPPIGMKPVLTFEQRSSRPLPPTPTETKTII